MKGRQSLSTAYLHAVLCGLATLDYHIQFYGLFYEKLLFSLSWITVKGNRERQKRIFITLAKIIPPWSMPRTRDYLSSLSQHFLRTFFEEVEASKTSELEDCRKSDTVSSLQGTWGSQRCRHWPQEPQESS